MYIYFGPWSVLQVNIDLISEKGNVIGRDRPSVRLFPLYLWNQLTSDRDLSRVYGPGIDNQSHRSVSRVRAIGLVLAKMVTPSF